MAVVSVGIVCAFLLLIGYVTLERRRHFRLFKNIGVPGPKPNFIWGNMRELRSGSSQLVDVMTTWESQYGDVYGYFTGVRPTLVIKDLDLVKEVLVRNHEDFVDRPNMIINVEPLINTLVGLIGTRWKEVRSMLSPCFSTNKMKQMMPLMGEALKIGTDILHKTAADEKSILYCQDEQGVVDAYKFFQGLTCDTISKCALAMEVDSQVNENDRFLVTIKGFLSSALSPFVKISLCFPTIAKLAEWGLRTFGYANEMTQMIIQSVKTAIEVRRGECIKSTTSDNKHFDVLQSMLEASEKVRLSNHRSIPPLSDDEIIANAWVFILGGFETTASALTFTTFLLSQHQEVQQKLYEEIITIVGFTDSFPTYDQLDKMEYLDKVVNESMRLYPPIVGFIIRRFAKSVQLGKYLISEGMNLQIPVWQIHHDPFYWPKPYEFEPERFDAANRKSLHPMAFIPFGCGQRSCIGKKFALIEVKLVIAAIIREFRILPPPERFSVPLTLAVPTVSLVPASKVHVQFVKRFPSF